MTDADTRRHDVLANMALMFAVKGHLIGYDTLEAIYDMVTAPPREKVPPGAVIHEAGSDVVNRDDPAGTITYVRSMIGVQKIEKAPDSEGGGWWLTPVEEDGGAATLSDSEIVPWEPSIPYGVGDWVKAPNPLTWWDRVRMFFGFSRKSPATREMHCVGRPDWQTLEIWERP